MEKNARTLAAMLDVLAEAGAQHALMGGLAAGYYGRERVTTDVDLLVSRRFLKDIQAGLERRGYVVRQFSYLVKMYAPGDTESVGDLVVQESNCVLRAAFAATTPVLILGLPVNVVHRGVFVALKFESALGPRRKSGDRLRDVLDIRSVLEKEFGPQDERIAAEIAGKMYPGAVADLASLINDLRSGRWPRVTRRTTIHSLLLVRRSLATLGRRGFR